MLKQEQVAPAVVVAPPAAFRRLCVETQGRLKIVPYGDPAAFRRLCVETS